LLGSAEVARPIAGSLLVLADPLHARVRPIDAEPAGRPIRPRAHITDRQEGKAEPEVLVGH
jgi:hypothetical protein